MGRPRRIQFPGACYLITLQGNNRADLFVSHQDRRQFLAGLAAAKERFGLKVYAYCLLPNRALLLLQTAAPNLSTAMQSLGTSYTKYFNSAHGSSGHVFQGRYQALLVDQEKYLVEMTRYVHLEPVRAKLTERPWRYQWSSCPHYVQLLEKKTLVAAEEVLFTLGRNRLTASVRYLKTLKERMKAATDILLPVARGRVVGHESFLERAQGRHEESGRPAEARSAGLALARRIMAEVAERRGIQEERLVGRLQWRDVSAARREAVHRIWKEARLGVTEISRLFNRTPSAISQIVRAMETRKV
jgi:REP element-mobilizing transposase RayT